MAHSITSAPGRLPHSDSTPSGDTSSGAAGERDKLLPFYLDGMINPRRWPDHSFAEEAEKAFRAAYLAAAEEVLQWTYPDVEAIEQALNERREARERGQVAVHRPNGIVLYYYRQSHEIELARTRGRHHCLEFAAQAWEHPWGDERLPQELPQWYERVKAWASEPLEAGNYSPPPRIDDFWPEAPPDDDWSPPPPKPRRTGNLKWVWRSDKPPPAVAKNSEPVKASQGDGFAPQSLQELALRHPRLRQPVVHGLLREGEIMNLISSPKQGKSWLVIDLSLSVATGRSWLDCFPCEQGRVLLIDNELHPESLAHRFSKVMEARGILFCECGDLIDIVTLRGKLRDIYGLGALFDQIERGRYRLVAIDAFYRAIPAGTDENSNADVAHVYNALDAYAAQLGSAFVLIHHASKGSQSGKSLVDVGAGASAMARATDSHLILRPHEEPGAVVLEAATRSWPPPEPRCLRWQYPVWVPDDSLDPADLKRDCPRRKPKLVEQPGPVKDAWTAQRFVAAFVGEQPMTRLAIEQVAIGAVGSRRQVERLLKLAEEQGLIHRWRFGPNQPVKFARQPQPLKDRH